MICCCNIKQTTGFVTIAVTAVVTGILWRSVFLAPVKLIVVFLHEFSHALATWLTCGKVKRIQVNEGFGGFCLSSGGCRPIILSAGYVGSCIFGVGFILSSVHTIATYAGAGVIIFACVATMLVLRIEAQNYCCQKFMSSVFLRIMVLVVAGIYVGLLILKWKVDPKIDWLAVGVLVLGTMNVLYAIFDCVDDLVCHKVDEVEQKSDSVMLAKEFCGFSRCWGVLWSMIALASAISSLVYYAYVTADDCKKR